eukprot:516317-Pyramimonas_sp.AAC.1
MRILRVLYDYTTCYTYYTSVVLTNLRGERLLGGDQLIQPPGVVRVCLELLAMKDVLQRLRPPKKRPENVFEAPSQYNVDMRRRIFRDRDRSIDASTTSELA